MDQDGEPVSPSAVAAIVAEREIARAQPGDKLRQAGIEGLQRPRIARHVARMAVERVEVDEIREDEIPVARHFGTERAEAAARLTAVTGEQLHL